LLAGALPGISRVAVLWDADAPAVTLQFREIEHGAQVLGMHVQSLAISGPTPNLDSALAAATRERAEALLVVGNRFLGRYGKQIVALATKADLPTMFTAREYVADGGLMSYSTNLDAQWRRAAYYVDRILKGTKPADLPIEQPMTFDFVVNLKTARELGITFPNEIMLQVTEVIQ